MRAVHQSAYKPKITNETQFIVNIRPVNRCAASLSTSVYGADGTEGAGDSSTCTTPVSPNNVGVGVGVQQNMSHRGFLRNSLAKVNWQRVFTISSLILSILLISCSIYLNLRQKNHLGRLNHQRKQHISTDVELTSTPVTVLDSNSIPSASVALSEDTTTTTKFTSYSSINSMASKDSMKSSENTFHATMDVNGSSSSSSSSGSGSGGNTRELHITEACMQCICETTTQCRRTLCADNVECGIFRISRSYWLDAGKPTLEGDDSYNNNNINNNLTATYDQCVNNIYCASRTVTAYINRYSRDCNHDGKIECRDHIVLHLLGPSGCIQSEGEMFSNYMQRMEDCLKNKYTDM